MTSIWLHTKPTQKALGTLRAWGHPKHHQLHK